MSYKSSFYNFVQNKDDESFLKGLNLKDESTEEELYVTFEHENTKIGKMILDIIKKAFQSKFFIEEEIETEIKFENTLKEINININEYFKDENIEKKNLNVIISVMNDGVLYLTQTGNAEAYLIRKGKLNVISDANTNKTDIFESVATGDLNDGDTLILSTSRLLRFLSNSQLISIFKGDTEEAMNLVEAHASSNSQESMSVVSVTLTKMKSVEDVSKEVRATNKSYKILSFFNKIFDIKKDKISKNVLFVGMIVVLIVLGVSVYAMVSNLSSRDELELSRKALEEISRDLERAHRMHLSGDTNGANNIIVSSKEKLAELINNDQYRDQAYMTMTLLSKTEEEINNIVRLKEPRVIADLSQQRIDIDTKGILYYKDTIFVFDFNSLYKTVLSVVEKPIEIEANEEIDNAITMEDRNIVIFHTVGGKIIEYDNEKMSIADTEDEKWKNAKDLGVFKKNLYILDPSSNQIWKYSRKNDIYSKAFEYLKEEIDLSKSVSMAIDGSIYILSNDGQITELYAGKKKDFNIKDLPSGILNSATKLYTEIDLPDLYVLDSVNNRVIVIQKGNVGSPLYKKQYIFDNIETIKDLFVDGKKLYVIDSSKIYETDLL